MEREPEFEEQRKDIYLKAAEDMTAGTLVVRSPPGPSTVRGATAEDDPGTITGVTLDDVLRGKGVWVRYFGAATARAATQKINEAR